MVKAFFGVWPKHQKLRQKINIESLKAKKISKMTCQSKYHQAIFSNRAHLALLALQTFMFDFPSRSKKLSIDGDKLRLTILNCSQLLLTD